MVAAAATAIAMTFAIAVAAAAITIAMPNAIAGAVAFAMVAASSIEMVPIVAELISNALQCLLHKLNWNF